MYVGKHEHSHSQQPVGEPTHIDRYEKTLLQRCTLPSEIK